MVWPKPASPRLGEVEGRRHPDDSPSRNRTICGPRPVGRNHQGNTMSICTARELHDARAEDPARRPEPLPAATTTCASATTASGGSATRSHPRPQSCPCCASRQSSHALADSDPNADEGRRLRRITAAWFCACIFALLLLWPGVAGEAQWSELLSESDRDRPSQLPLLGNESG